MFLCAAGVLMALLSGVAGCGRGQDDAAARAAPGAKAATSAVEETLSREMAYLPELPEVEWSVVRGDEVWVGFADWPADGQTVINGAARHGSEQIGDYCTVWAVRSDQRAQCPPGPKRCYGWVIAKAGVIRDTSADQ